MARRCVTNPGQDGLNQPDRQRQDATPLADDKAVFAAYDWPDDLSDEEILERLLVLNLERATLSI
jgi:hypothetical protein